MKLEKHKNLNEESSFYWREIADGTLKFDRRESEVSVCFESTVSWHVSILFSFVDGSILSSSSMCLTWNIFTGDNQQVAALRALGQQELIDFFNDHIKVGALQRKSLSVQVFGGLHNAEYQAAKCNTERPQSSHINDIFCFRRSLSLYGSFKGGFGHMKLWGFLSLCIINHHTRNRKGKG